MSDFQTICIRIIIDIKNYTFPFPNILQNSLVESAKKLKEDGY